MLHFDDYYAMMLRLLVFWRQSLSRSGKRILRLIFPRWWCCLCLRRYDEYFCRLKRNKTRRKAAKLLLLRRRQVGRTKLGAFNTLRKRESEKWRHFPNGELIWCYKMVLQQGWYLRRFPTSIRLVIIRGIHVQLWSVSTHLYWESERE